MFSEPQLIPTGPNNYKVQHGTDQGLFVNFYYESVKDEEKSTEAGRPIFTDREYIKIIPVGDKNTVICEPVTEEYKYRFPVQYAAFKRQEVQPQEGTPLEEWPILTKSQALNFKSANVHTVEQLANVSDTNLHNLGMGAAALREKAKVFLQSASSTSAVVSLQEQLADALTQIQALKNQLAGFSAETKKRGRPPKKEDVDGYEDVA